MANKICGGCTACCYALKVPEIQKPSAEWCKHCDIGIGCNIYSTRPEQCKEFKCAWLQSNSSDDLRPDRCGVIFERVDDYIFFGSLLPGFSISKLITDQINSLRAEGFSAIVYSLENGRSIIYLAEWHSAEFVKERIQKFLGNS